MWSSVMRSACVTKSAALRFVVTPLLAWDSPSNSCSRVPTCEAASIAADKNSDDVFMMTILPESLASQRLQEIENPASRSETGFPLPSTPRSLTRGEIVVHTKIPEPRLFRVADHQRELPIDLVLDTKIRRDVWVRRGRHGAAIVG